MGQEIVQEDVRRGGQQDGLGNRGINDALGHSLCDSGPRQQQGDEREAALLRGFLNHSAASATNEGGVCESHG